MCIVTSSYSPYSPVHVFEGSPTTLKQHLFEACYEIPVSSAGSNSQEFTRGATRIAFSVTDAARYIAFKSRNH